MTRTMPGDPTKGTRSASALTGLSLAVTGCTRNSPEPDILGISVAIVLKHYAKWSQGLDDD